MRLQKIIIEKIKKSVLASYGDVDIYLFSSRVDDTKKGGDIDLAIDMDISKVKFISNLLRLGFDMKIDIVPYNTKNDLLLQQIHKNSVLLN